MRKLLLLFNLAILFGCDEAPRARRPPASDTAEETPDDLRDRRRGSRSGDEPFREDDRPEAPTDDRRRNPTDPVSDRRRKPTNRDAQAIERAEDAADAETDRPLRPN
jgi:hypothetical protein